MHIIRLLEMKNTVRRPATREEEDQLIQDGFQFVRYDEKHREPVYRKRK
jgi:hypothetical protein